MKHDWLSLQDICNFVKQFLALMDLGTHEQKIFFALQFQTWYQLLFGDVEEVMTHDLDLESGEPTTRMMTIVKVEARALHRMRAPGIYNSDPRVKARENMSVA